MKIRILHIVLLFVLSLVGKAQDITPPDAPVIDSVTVLWDAPSNPNGDVLITWQKSDSADVRSYYIKYLNEVLGTYKFLDSVDANTTTYLDTKVITDPHYPQTYVIQAVDSSNNTSNHSEPHKTVRVFPWQKDESCKVNVELTWNAYEGWSEGIEYFDLYVVVDNVHSYLGRFASDETSYLYPLGNTNSHYEYYMRIKSNNGRTSTSNKIPFTPDIPIIPTYIKAEYVSVEGEQIRMKFLLDTLADASNYRLMRSVDSLGGWQSIMQFNDIKKPVLDITDEAVEVNEHQYFYKLNLYNGCNSILDSSRVLSSVLLKGEANSSEHLQYLYWSSYFNSLNMDKSYKLYRFSETDLPIIINTSSSNYHYIDDLRNQNFESFVGDFCYYLEVDADYSGPELIKSNTICLAQEPSLHMPTAFTPNGYPDNRIFKPSFAFISSDNYYFAIYDKWGFKVFETRDYKEGWSGRKNGFTYPNGLYSYYLEYFSSEQEKYVETGLFNLIN